MDEIQAQQLQKWLAEKWKHGPCPVCQANSWEPLGNMGQIPNLLPVGPLGGNTVPVLLIYCTNCGYLLPINAIVAGIPAPHVVMDSPEEMEESHAENNQGGEGG